MFIASPCDDVPVAGGVVVTVVVVTEADETPVTFSRSLLDGCTHALNKLLSAARAILWKTEHERMKLKLILYLHIRSTGELAPLLLIGISPLILN